MTQDMVCFGEYLMGSEKNRTFTWLLMVPRFSISLLTLSAFSIGYWGELESLSVTGDLSFHFYQFWPYGLPGSGVLCIHTQNCCLFLVNSPVYHDAMSLFIQGKCPLLCLVLIRWLQAFFDSYMHSISFSILLFLISLHGLLLSISLHPGISHGCN